MSFAQLRSGTKHSAAQRCLDHLASAGRWTANAAAASREEVQPYDWTAPAAGRCGLRTPLSSMQARALLKGEHIVVVGDLAARLWFSALLYLVNGTRHPDEVADGYPMHRNGDGCVWKADAVHNRGYDFGGWAHFRKGSRCFLRWYGWRAGTLINLTIAHKPGSKAWWGRGTTRDVMTMLLREKLLSVTWRLPAADFDLTYLWKGVVRTSGSYAQQHARHVAQEAERGAGRPPTIIVTAWGAYDSQWQNADEVAKRLAGANGGLAARWPAGAPRAPLLVAVGPSSCPRSQPYSFYQGRGTRSGSFKNLDNASALVPLARQAAANHSVLFVDTSAPQMSVPPLRSSPCTYDLPVGVMAEALVQMTLSGLAAASAAGPRRAR